MYIGSWERYQTGRRLRMRAGEQFWKCIIQFENITYCPLSKTPKIKIYKTILPVLFVGLKSGFLL
jgi:hypothetical protein